VAIGGLTTAIGLSLSGIATDIIEIKRELDRLWRWNYSTIQPSCVRLAELGLADACVERRWRPFVGWEFCDDAVNASKRVHLIPTSLDLNTRRLTAFRVPVAATISDDGGKALREVSVRLGLTVDRIDDDGTQVHLRFLGRKPAAAMTLFDRSRRHVLEDSRAQSSGSGTTAHFQWVVCMAVQFFPARADMTWGSVHYSRRAKAGLVPMSPTLMYMFSWSLWNRGNPKKRYRRSCTSRCVNGSLTSEGTNRRVARPDHRSRPVVVLPTHGAALAARRRGIGGRVLLIGDAAHSTTPQLSPRRIDRDLRMRRSSRKLLPQNRPLDDIFGEFMRRRLQALWEFCREHVAGSSVAGKLTRSKATPHPESGSRGIDGPKRVGSSHNPIERFANETRNATRRNPGRTPIDGVGRSVESCFIRRGSSQT